jgi:hypothetical protein
MVLHACWCQQQLDKLRVGEAPHTTHCQCKPALVLLQDYHVPVSGGTGEPVRLRVAHVTVEMAPIAKVRFVEPLPAALHCRILQHCRRGMRRSINLKTAYVGRMPSAKVGLAPPRTKSSHAGSKPPDHWSSSASRLRTGGRHGRRSHRAGTRGAGGGAPCVRGESSASSTPICCLGCRCRLLAVPVCMQFTSPFGSAPTQTLQVQPLTTSPSL